MINAPIFKHSGGFKEEEEFQSQKMMKEIYPTRNVAIDNQKFTLSGIISHVNGTSLESGHFVADIISGDKMFHCDDDRVSRSEHLSGFGYVFTYSRTDQVDANENIQIVCDNDDDDIRCESCNEPFKMTSILRHVANSKCKHKVSAEFINHMKENAANRRKNRKAKHYQDNKDIYQDLFSKRHEEHKERDINRRRQRHQEHKAEENASRRQRHQEHKAEENASRRQRHQEHKAEENASRSQRHQEHKADENASRSQRHQEHKMEDNLRDRKRHQEHKMEDNLRCKERYRESKEIIHSSADVATRFKIFKEETMEGKIQLLHIHIIT